MSVAITGNTYPHRLAFRAMGGQWDGAAKAWLVPAEKADEARALVSGGGGATRQEYAPRRSRYSRYGSSYTRFSSGHEVYTNRAGRCIDAPCCGCCS